MSTDMDFAKVFASSFQSIQRQRVAIELSLDKRKANGEEIPEDATGIHTNLVNLEDQYAALLARVASSDPVWIWMNSLKGLGERLAAMIISQVDIEKAHTRTSLWKYSGYGMVATCPMCQREKTITIIDKGIALCPTCNWVVDTHAFFWISDRRFKGRKITYNNTLKKTIYLTTKSLVRWGCEPYATIYKESMEFYSRRNLAPMHTIKCARRRTCKIFLDHLYFIWRWSHCLRTRLPYELEYLGHKDIIPPPNFDPDVYFHKTEYLNDALLRETLLRQWCPVEKKKSRKRVVVA